MPAPSSSKGPSLRASSPAPCAPNSLSPVDRARPRRGRSVTLRFALPVALALLVAAFVALAPATLADVRVAAASGGRLRLADTTGTVWRGSGTLTDAQGLWRIPLRWRVSPPGALRGVADVELEPSGRIVAN